jgi:hypothetical protein
MIIVINMQFPLDTLIIDLLNSRLSKLEETLNSDVITIYSPIHFGVEKNLFLALEKNTKRKEKLAIILDTVGGIVEVVERMVQVSRSYYSHITFIIPDKAMSAGTVFTMSGDKIMMNPFSVLGPIDPQIAKNGKLIPALAYLSEYESLIKKSQKKELTTAEYALLSKLDLGELHTFKQARNLSIELIKKWLPKYKFKDWITTETKNSPVTQQIREERANKIATVLSNHALWCSHGRCISMDTLRDELINLKIENYFDTHDLKKAIHDYFDIFSDFLRQKGINTFVHSRYFI